MGDKPDDLRRRTKTFALEIIKLCQKLTTGREAKILGNQLLRAGTAVAANYRAACRARSRAEFIAKLGVVVEEADETVFWCELLEEASLVSRQDIKEVVAEARELLSIFSAGRKTAKNRMA